MKISVELRREKVAEYLLKGMTEIEIAQQLDVSRQTIIRDVSVHKKEAKPWLDGLAKEGFIFEYKMALDKIRDRENFLQKLLDNETDTKMKAHLVKTLNDCTKLYISLLSDAPTIHSLRKLREQR